MDVVFLLYFLGQKFIVHFISFFLGFNYSAHSEGNKWRRSRIHRQPKLENHGHVVPPLKGLACDHISVETKRKKSASGTYRAGSRRRRWAGKMSLRAKSSPPASWNDTDSWQHTVTHTSRRRNRSTYTSVFTNRAPLFHTGLVTDTRQRQRLSQPHTVTHGRRKHCVFEQRFHTFPSQQQLRSATLNQYYVSHCVASLRY